MTTQLSGGDSLTKLAPASSISITSRQRSNVSLPVTNA